MANTISADSTEIPEEPQMSYPFRIAARQIRAQYDADDLRTMATEMASNGHDGLKVEKERLSQTSLQFLSEFKHLKGLSIYGVSRDIQIVSQLTELRELAICGLGTKDLAFAKDLPHLAHLWLQGLRLKDWTSVGELTQVKALTLFNLSALDSIDFLSDMTALEYVELVRCKGIKQFPDCKRLDRLRRVVLDQTNGLTSLAELANAPALERLVVMGAKSLPTNCFACFNGHLTLKGILPGVAPTNSSQFLETCRSVRSGMLMRDYYGTPDEHFEIT